MQYVLSRYFVYFIQFLNSLFIAIYLGPFYLGVWGFINLTVQYFEQINFGVTQSFNAIGAIYKEDKQYVSKVFSTSLFTMMGVAALAFSFFVLNSKLEWNIGDKYNFKIYGPYVCLIAVLGYFTPLFLNLLRIYGNVLLIALSQSITPVLTFIVLHFFKEEALVLVLLKVLLLSPIITLILAYIKSPIKITFYFDYSLFTQLIEKGIYLFFYSGCFYFILLSTKSFISHKYTVEEFGLFTFSFSLGNVILLLFKSFVFLIFPKVINRLAHAENDKVLLVIENARRDYVSMAHLTGHFAILLYPLFIYFFPKYIDTVIAFNIIVLSLVVYTHCFGFQELFIAKNKDRTLGVLALISLLVNLIGLVILIYVIQVSFHYVILATMFSYVTFLILLIIYSRRLLDIETNLKSVFKMAFGIKLLTPFIISMLFSVLKLSNYYYIIPLIIYLVLNFNSLLTLKDTFKKILNKPEVIDI